MVRFEKALMLSKALDNKVMRAAGGKLCMFVHEVQLCLCLQQAGFKIAEHQTVARHRCLHTVVQGIATVLWSC